MRLECLIVTCDSSLLGHLKATFGAHEVSLDLRQDSASAIELASRRHFDGVIIDCDDVQGGTEAIVQVRNGNSNQQSLIVAVVNAATNPKAALDLGANLVLCKPIQENRLQSILEIAVPRMEREHRRYFRYNVDLPVRLRNPLGQALTAQMKNVSEGGLAVKLVDPVKLKGVVIVEFELPSTEAQTFHAKADVVWSDSFGMGLRFLYIEKDSGIALHDWLKSLESQSQFRESARRTW
jgi:DNA-binding response OmpR family regulator